MSCEYCRQTPHDPRCPKAPPPEPVPCLICGRLFEDPEDLTCGICDKCLEDSYIPDRGRDFAFDDISGFIKATYGVALDGTESSEQRQKAMGILFKSYFAVEYWENPEYLRDYCLQDKEFWAAWLRETMCI